MLLRPLRWWWNLAPTVKWVMSPFFLLVLLIYWLVVGPIIVLYYVLAWPPAQVLERVLASRDERVDHARAYLEAQIQRQIDVSNDLVQTAKPLIHREQGGLRNVVEARTGLELLMAKQPSIAEKIGAATDLQEALERLLAKVESDPENKSREQVGDMRRRLTGTASSISQARARYNEEVQRYNTTGQQLPWNLVVNLSSFEPKPRLVEGDQR